MNEWFDKLVDWIRLRFNETYVSPATTTSSPSSLTTNRPMSPLEPERFSFGLTLPENGLLWWNAAAGTLGYALIWFPIFLRIVMYGNWLEYVISVYLPVPTQRTSELSTSQGSTCLEFKICKFHEQKLYLLLIKSDFTFHEWMQLVWPSKPLFPNACELWTWVEQTNKCESCKTMLD